MGVIKMPDVRLIDANALMKHICGYECGCNPEECDGMESETVTCNFHAYVIEAPTIEAEPVKRGKWIIGRHEFGTGWHCSMCDFIVYFKHRYCNNCGARMVNG